MSYSDYGGFAWQVKDGKWERFQAAEDGTLVGVEAPSERPLEAAFGFKFDVLLNAYEKQGLDYKKDSSEQSADDWLVKHPHHCVLGGMAGIGLVGHKGSVSVTLNGKRIKYFPSDGTHFDPHKRGEAEAVDLGEWKYALKASTALNTYHSKMALLRPDGSMLVGVSGYGIGEHWWKDEEGYEHLRLGDCITLMFKTRHKPRTSKSHYRKHARKMHWKYEVDPIGMTREEYKALEKKYEIMWSWNSWKDEIDRKKYGDNPDIDLGRRPTDPWPGYEQWLKEVRMWADPIIGKWKGET